MGEIGKSGRNGRQWYDLWVFIKLFTLEETIQFLGTGFISKMTFKIYEFTHWNPRLLKKILIAYGNNKIDNPTSNMTNLKDVYFFAKS